MKIDCVLTACNINEMYLDGIPYFIKVWKKIMPHIDIKIILIASKLPNNLTEYSNHIILFEPLKDISSAFISQYIRILYPSILDYKHGILLTDIDIVPMNSKYYIDNISSFDNNRFISYLDFDNKKIKQIQICYNVASNKTFSEIFQIKNIDDINEKLKQAFSEVNYPKTDNLPNWKKGNYNGWGKDQDDLYEYINKWKNKNNRYICVNTLDKTNKNITSMDRLCRSKKFKLNEDIIKKIKEGKYTDYHIYRPYSKYKNINNTILNLL